MKLRILLSFSICFGWLVLYAEAPKNSTCALYWENVGEKPDTEQKTLEIAGRRFIDPEHWEMATRDHKLPSGQSMAAGAAAYSAYGEKPFEAWTNGVRYVQGNSGLRPPTLDDYLAIHKIVYGYDGHAFKGFFKDRIERNLKTSSEKRQAYKLLNRNDIPKLIEAIKEEEPLGKLRDGVVAMTSPTPTMSSIGDAIIANRSNHFSSEQIARLQKNPYLKVVISRTSAAGFRGVIYYPKPENVPMLMRSHFAWLQHQTDELKKSGLEFGTKEYREKGASIAAEMYYRLVSTHGTWDGSGRTSKLTRDWVLQNLGLPPPAFTPANDLELTIPELTEITLRGMEETEKAFAQSGGRLFK